MISIGSRPTMVADGEPRGFRAISPSIRGAAGAKRQGTVITLRVPANSFTMPNIDFSALIQMPKIDIAALVAPLNTGDWITKLGAGSLLPANTVGSILTGALPGLAKSHGVLNSLIAPSTGALIEGLMEGWRGTIAGINADLARSVNWDSILRLPITPDNWSDQIHGQLSELVELVNVDGIPAAWVPRAEILEALLSATTGDARSEILIERREDILDDCAAVLSDLQDNSLADGISIANEVVASCRVGHWRVAALAAIPIIHSMVESLNWASDRQRAEHHHQLRMDMEYRRLTEMATRAPLVNFYDDWHPKSGKPRPAHLTRHVASHRLGVDQVTARNCTVAVMLMASLLMTVHQLKLGQRAIAA